MAPFHSLRFWAVVVCVVLFPFQASIINLFKNVLFQYGSCCEGGLDQGNYPSAILQMKVLRTLTSLMFVKRIFGSPPAENHFTTTYINH